MSKSARIVLIIILILLPLIFYKYFHKGRGHRSITPFIHTEMHANKPQVAIIFDDLGESVKDLTEIRSLGTPVTISIIPGLKFSNNIAHLASRAGYSVFIHIPMEPNHPERFVTSKYKFVGASMPRRELDSLLRYYLNSIRVAIGVNNHMGSLATKDARLMRTVIAAIKQKGLIFVDSYTSGATLGYKIAKREGVICGKNEGFFDSLEDPQEMKARFEELVARAKEKGKVIIIAHPKKKTFELLKEELPVLKDDYEFVTIKDYFGL